MENSTNFKFQKKFKKIQKKFQKNFKKNFKKNSIFFKISKTKFFLKHLKKVNEWNEVYVQQFQSRRRREFPAGIAWDTPPPAQSHAWGRPRRPVSRIPRRPGRCAACSPGSFWWSASRPPPRHFRWWTGWAWSRPVGESPTPRPAWPVES